MGALGWAVAGLCAAVAGAPDGGQTDGGAVEEPTFHGSEAFIGFRRSGYKMLGEKLVDLDGDGRIDSVVLEGSERGIGLSAWRLGEAGYQMLSRSAPLDGSEVAVFEARGLGAAERAFVLDVFEDSPDEADHAAAIFVAGPGGLAPALALSYRVTHPEEEAGRPPRQVTDLGGLKPGWELLPQATGWPLVRLHRDPKIISARGEGGRRAWFAIGIRRALYRPEGGRYVLQEESYIDYLPRIPARVSDAGGAKAADGDPRTAWTADPAREGAGASIALTLEPAASLRMIRVIPGCGSSREEWERNHRAARFRIRLDGGVELVVDRKDPAAWSPLLAGIEDFALPERDFGLQTLVFLSRPVRTRSVRITVEGLEQGAAEGRTCLAEISLHRALAEPP